MPRAARTGLDDGGCSKPVPRADVIDDGLPVVARGAGMAHHPIPEIGILHVEQFVECQPRGFVGVGEALVEPATEESVQFARAAAGTPAKALEAGFIHRMIGSGFLASCV